MSELFDRGLRFATRKHAGQVRKFSALPYILHPIEVAVIISTMTDDEDAMVAGLLHDTLEDTETTPEEIKEEFGAHILALVSSESEDKLGNQPADLTWKQRKEDSLLSLEHTKNINVKIMWLADKLSNMRSFYRLHMKMGDSIWLQLNQKDKKEQEWYYRTVAELVPELKDTAAYMEYTELLDKVFGGQNND